MSDSLPFDWKCQPKAEQVVLEAINNLTQLNPSIAQLEKDLYEKTSTRLFDWVDHIYLPQEGDIRQQLEDSGFSIQTTTDQATVYAHLGAQLPRVALSKKQKKGVAVSVEKIADFLLVRGQNAPIEGPSLESFRRSLINHENGVSFYVIERRSTLSIDPPTKSMANHSEQYLRASELWETRNRSQANEDEAIRESFTVAQEMIDLVGQNMAAWIILEIERRYWQSRNTAGQLQKNRQDRLGMGWANHDHHTFRSSRRHFSQLVRLFEMLGFHCRERFYAGQEAGWGAQVMENPICRLVLFLDVDLAPHEIDGDFAHQTLPDIPKLGTIGLWCALHGDSILKGGMHHLEAQFMFDHLTEDLNKQGVKMMNPFSNFPYLKQAFTMGEIWPVDPHRVQKLLKEGKITSEQAERFLTQGAIGSHLENLQRREGYKGFNQKNVSLIIKKTDPRLQ